MNDQYGNGGSRDGKGGQALVVFRADEQLTEKHKYM
jgi:hypothetical protein